MIVAGDAADEPWSMAAATPAEDDDEVPTVEDGTPAREWRELTWENGDRYVGEWVGDLMDGQGTWFGVDGDRYEGEWRDGERHGHGVFTGKDGDTYDGQWDDGVEHGRGLYGDPEHGWILAVWDDGEAVQILSRGEAGVEPPSLGALDPVAADDDGRATGNEAACSTTAVSLSGHVTGHANGLSVGQTVSANTKPQKLASHGESCEGGPVTETQAAANTPQTVDAVMACLRKELKNRRAMGNAKGFFTFFDADGDGDVDGDEFKAALSQLIPTLSEDLLEAVYREVDTDGDGSIDYSEFAARMFKKPGVKQPTAPKRSRIGDVQKRRGRSFKPGVAEALDPISVHLEQLKKFSYVRKAKKKAGRATGRSVADGKTLKLSEEELLARQVDNIFRVIRQQMEGARTLYGKKLKDAKQAFALMDKDGDGTLDETELKQAMERLGVGLTDLQLSKLMRAVDKDGEGTIDYNEFVERVGLDDGDDEVGERLTDAEALHKHRLAAEAAQTEAAGGGGLVSCAFEFAEPGYTGLTFGDVGGCPEVTGIVGGPAEALGFGDFGLRAGARLTSVNSQPISATTPFVDAIRMVQKAVRPLILGFEVHPVVVEVKVRAESDWKPAMVTQIHVKYELDTDGNLSGPITRGNTVQLFSIELLPIGDGLMLNALPCDRVRIREETEPGEQAYATVGYLSDEAARKQLRVDLALAWMAQADSLTNAASHLSVDSEAGEKSEMLTKAWEHYHEALGHALAAIDSPNGKQLCAELYTKRSKLQVRRSLGDPTIVALAKEDAEHALALDPNCRDAKALQSSVIDMLWSGRDGDTEAVKAVQAKVRSWLVRKGRTDAEAAALKYGVIWRTKAARQAAPERRRRAKLSHRASEQFAKAQKLFSEVRPGGSLARVETLLADARGMSERARDLELQAQIEGMQAQVVARQRAERHEKDAQKLQRAMGAAGSELTRQPYLELFTA